MAAVADGIALYRIRGEEALLLYIGISDDFGRRWKQHAKEQPWWGEMRSLSVDCWYETRVEAEEAEKAAIKAEGPKYNKEHALPPGAKNWQPVDDAEIERMLNEAAERARSWMAAELSKPRRPLTPRQQAKAQALLEDYYRDKVIRDAAVEPLRAEPEIRPGA